jgi:hypothetical protein
MKASKITALALAALVGVAVFGGAQREASAQFRIGPHLGYNFDVEELYIGADAWIGLFTLSETIELHGMPSFSYYVGTEFVTLFVLDLDLTLKFDVADMVAPYAFGGLGISFASVDDTDISDTEFDFNLGGGALFLPDGMLEPFTELRLRLGDSSSVELRAGLLFRF